MFRCQKAKEERKSRRKKAQQDAQSNPQLSATLQSTQLDSLLTQSREEGEGEEGEGEVSRSPSPTHSLYSSSFHSESPQYSSDEDGGRKMGSPYSLSEFEHSAVVNEGQIDDLDEGLNGGVDMSTDPMLNAEETNSAKKDGGEMKLGTEDGAGMKLGREEADTTEARPELVTRGGVTIVYQVGPVPTSECGTQTDDYTTGTALVPAEAETQTNEETTGYTTEFGTQTDEQAIPELGTQTDEQVPPSAPELETHTDEQDAPKSAVQTGKQGPEQNDDQDALRPEKRKTESTALDAAGKEENKNRQIDTNPELTAEEQKANPEPLTINESEVASTRRAQLPESQIQLGKDDSTARTTEDAASQSSPTTQPPPPNTPSDTTDTSNTADTNRANEGESNNRRELMQTAQESLPSPPIKVDNNGKLSSISRSTLTDVSERTSISPSSSMSPSPSGGSSQTELSQLADNVKQEEGVATRVQNTDRHEVVGDEDLT